MSAPAPLLLESPPLHPCGVVVAGAVGSQEILKKDDDANDHDGPDEDDDEEDHE